MLFTSRPVVPFRRGAAMATAALALVTLSGCGDTSTEDSASDPTQASGPPSSTAPQPDPTTEATSEATSEPTSEPTSEAPPSEPAAEAVKGDGYSLAVPEGWEDLSDQAEDVPQLALADLVYGDAGETGFASNFNTIVTPAGGESVDDPGVREQLAAQVQNAIGVTPEPVDDVQIDGEQAIGQTATVKESGAKLVQYVTVHDDNAYTLTVTLSEARAPDSQAIVDGIVDSWSWTK